MRCEKLRFDQGCALGAPNAPVGPSLLDAQPKGVASEGKCGGVKRGIRNPEGVLAPSCLRRQTAANRCIGGDKPFAEGKRGKDAHPCSR